MPNNQYDSPGRSGVTGTKTQLTPELVQQVTDKVYKLFLKDVKQENERRRLQNQHYRR
jgi:hypothetical protein